MLPTKVVHPFRNPLSWVQTHRNAATYLERAMGFEPTTTSLGSYDSPTELRPLAESNPTLGLHAKSRISWQLPLQFHQRKLSASDLQAIGSSSHNRYNGIRIALFLFIDL